MAVRCWILSWVRIGSGCVVFEGNIVVDFGFGGSGCVVVGLALVRSTLVEVAAKLMATITSHGNRCLVLVLLSW